MLELFKSDGKIKNSIVIVKDVDDTLSGLKIRYEVWLLDSGSIIHQYEKKFTSLSFRDFLSNTFDIGEQYVVVLDQVWAWVEIIEYSKDV